MTLHVGPWAVKIAEIEVTCVNLLARNGRWAPFLPRALGNQRCYFSTPLSARKVFETVVLSSNGHGLGYKFGSVTIVILFSSKHTSAESTEESRQNSHSPDALLQRQQRLIDLGALQSRLPVCGARHSAALIASQVNK